MVEEYELRQASVSLFSFKNAIMAITCTMCKSIFNRSHNLEKHLKLVHFYCIRCNTYKESKNEILQHYNVSHETSYPECEDCQDIFIDQSRLKNHKERKHKEENKQYSCHMCQYSKVTKETLTKHLH